MFSPECEARSWCCFCNCHLSSIIVLLFFWENERKRMARSSLCHLKKKRKKRMKARKRLVITAPGTCEVAGTKGVSTSHYHHIAVTIIVIIVITEIPLLARSEPHALGLLV